MFNIFRKRPPVGSTDWAAQKFLGMLDQEEREKAELERLRRMGWQPGDSRTPASANEPGFGDGRDAVVDLVQRDIDYQRALQAEARRRAAFRTASASGRSSPTQVAQQGKEASPPVPAPSEPSAPSQPGSGAKPANSGPRQNYYEGGWSIDEIHRLSQEELLNRLRTVSHLPGPHPMLSAAGREANANLHLAPETTRYEEPLRQRLVEAALNDPIVRDAEFNWSKLSLKDRERVLKRAIELHTQIFGYDPPTLTLGDARGANARYEQGDNRIIIDPSTAKFRDGLQSIGLAMEEASHAYQWKLIRDFAASRIPRDDPAYALAETLYLTNSYYIPGEMEVGKYHGQPIEQHADDIAGAVDKALRDAWRRRTNQ